MERQRTIKKEVKLEGIGIHSGRNVQLRFKPSLPNSGINFSRVDLPGNPLIDAHISRVIDPLKCPRRTSIAIGDIEVHTIEHLMAALWGMAIDNILVEVNGDEIPNLDGSALPFLEVLKEAGIKEQDASRKSFQIREPIWIEDSDAKLVILPSNKFGISYTLSYDHPLLHAQYLEFPSLKGETFENDIAPSRTFCLEQEVDNLRRQGLGKGANYENTLVVGEGGVIDNDLRFEDEFARHKVLDLIGDLCLLGFSIVGHTIGLKSGHPLNIQLLRKIEYRRQKMREASVMAQYSGVRSGGLDINAIQRILPHRYPFLLVDRILELEENRRAVGIKNVTINDNFFRGHFPGRPVMPGVLIIEAMAQVAGILILSRRESFGKYAYFMSMDKVKFRKTVVPGDQLRLEAEVAKLKSKTGQVRTKALVGGSVVAEADLLFALVEP